MENDIIEIKQAEMLAGITRSEIDIQIATAKQYPRDLNTVLNKIATYATMDRETAEDCFYVLRRKDANGNDNTIEGLSIRMAEIIAGAWGNLRVQTRIIGNDGRKITAQAVCHDLETNFAVCKTVDRRITTKTGKTYSDDMQVVTGNAVLAVIPKAVTKRVINEVKKVALGQAIDVETSRKNCLANFAKAGVTEAMICQYLSIKAIAEIDKEKLFELRATWNAIKEGTTTVQETFVKPQLEAKAQEEANKKTASAADKAAAAIAQATGEIPANVDPETGEIKEEKSKKTSTSKK